MSGPLPVTTLVRGRLPSLILIALATGGLWSCSSSQGPSIDASGFRGRVVEIAEREWRYFGRHQRGRVNRTGYKEDEPQQARRIRRYWREGVGRSVSSSRTPWSGAFISYVMRQAGAGKFFYYSGSHSPNVRRAIANKRNREAAGGFWGHRVGDYAPRPGDLVCNALQDGVDYDDHPRFWSGHCDIVVQVRRGSIDVIGGNLSDTVGKRTLRTDSSGRLYAHQRRRLDPYVKRWFVVVEPRF